MADWLDHFLPTAPPPDQGWMSHFLPEPDFSDAEGGSSVADSQARERKRRQLAEARARGDLGTDPIAAKRSDRPAAMPPANSDLSRVPGASYEKNGFAVINSRRIDSDGHVPTHRLAALSSRPDFQSGEPVEALEKRVLSRKLPPQAASNDLELLAPDVQQIAADLSASAAASGHRLGIGETFRPQDRQDYLFQQGRSRPGPIVTWTLTSDHTNGRAIDFTGDAKSLEWLQAEASRRGLSTLGAMDPGHVSIPDPRVAKRAQLAAARALIAPEPGLTSPDDGSADDPSGVKAFGRGIASGAKQGVDFLAHLPNTLVRGVASLAATPIQAFEEEERRRNIQAKAEEGDATLEDYRRASASTPPVHELAPDRGLTDWGLPPIVEATFEESRAERERLKEQATTRVANQPPDWLDHFAPGASGALAYAVPQTIGNVLDPALALLGGGEVAKAARGLERFGAGAAERAALRTGARDAAEQALKVPITAREVEAARVAGVEPVSPGFGTGHDAETYGAWLDRAGQRDDHGLRDRFFELHHPDLPELPPVREASPPPMMPRMIPQVPRWAATHEEGIGRLRDALRYEGMAPEDLPFDPRGPLPLTRWEPEGRQGTGNHFDLGDTTRWRRLDNPPRPAFGGTVPRAEWYTPSNPLVRTGSPGSASRLVDEAAAKGHDVILNINSLKPESIEVVKTPLAGPGIPRESPFLRNPKAPERTWIDYLNAPGDDPWAPPPPRIPLDAMPDPAAVQKPEFRQIVDLPPEVADAVHREGVTQAVDAGERVPPPVLKDYPDLSAEVGLPSPRNPDLPAFGSPSERGFVKIPAGPNFLKRWFTSGGQFSALGEQKGWAFERARAMGGAVKANEFKVRNTLRDFSSAFADDVVEAGHQDPAAVLDYITEGLQGGNDLSGVSPKLRAAAQAMRDHISAQSDQYLTHADLSASLRNAIEQNRDTYFPRAHAAFHEPNWPAIVDPTSSTHDPREAWRWNGFMDWAKAQRELDQRAIYRGGRVRIDGADLPTPDPENFHYGQVVRVGVDPREAMKEVRADPQVAGFQIPRGPATKPELEASVRQATSPDAIRLWDEARRGDRAFTQALRELPPGYDVTLTEDHAVASTPAGDQRAFPARRGGLDQAHLEARAWLRDQARAEPDPNALTEEALQGAGLGDKLPAREELRGIRNKEAALLWDDQRSLPDARAQAIAERKALRNQKFGEINDREANNVLVAFDDGTSAMLPREKVMGTGGFAERSDDQIAGYGQKLLNKDPDAFLSMTRPAVGRESGGNLKRRLIMDPRVDDLPSDLAERVKSGKISLPGAIDNAKARPGWWADYVAHAPGLPQELDDLLGLYRDPSVRYKVGAMRAGHDLAVHQFHQNLLDRGAGTIFHEEPTQGFFTQIGGKGPLAEQYTTPEIAAVIRGTDNTSRQAGPWLNAWRKFNGVVKLGKTAGNFPRGPMRDLLNWHFHLMAGGHFTAAFNPAEFARLLPYQVADKLGTQRGAIARMAKRLADSVELADGSRLGERWSMNLDEMRPEIEHLYSNGVFGNSPRGAVMREYLGSLAPAREPAAISTTRKVLSAPAKGAIAFWEGTHDIGRHVYYRSELHDLLWANGKLGGMEKLPADYFTRPEFAAEAAEAARRTSLTTHTQAMIPGGITALKDSPFSAFPGFHSEIYRASKEQVKTALADLASSNPRMKVLGAKRLGGFLSTAALAGGGLAATWNHLSGAKEPDAVRPFMPPWSRNSQLAVLNVDKASGQVRTVDLSAFDPYTIYMNGAATILRGISDPQSDKHDVAIDAAQNFLSPFTDEDIVSNLLLDLARNKQVSGGVVPEMLNIARHHEERVEGYPVHTPGAAGTTQAKQIAYAFYRSLAPAGLAGLQGERVARALLAEKPEIRKYLADLSNYDRSLSLSDEAWTLGGLRVTTTDLSKALARKGADYVQSRADATSLYSRRSRMGQGLEDPEMVIAAKAEANQMARAAHEQTAQAIASALKLGYTDDQVRQWLKHSRVGKRHVGALIEDAQRFNAGFPATGSYLPVIP